VRVTASRHRIALLAAALCATALAACTAEAGSTADATTAPSASAGVASPSPTGPPAGAPIPDSAFFTPPANRTREQPEKPTDGHADMPALCDADFASDAKIGRQRTRHIVFFEVNASPDTIPDGTVDHTIAVYQPGAAAVAMAEIRNAVAACPTDDQEDGVALKYELLAPKNQGDDVLLIQETWTPPADGTAPDAGPSKGLISIVRVGDVLTVLKVYGWEGIDADRAVTQAYTDLAVRTITKWRG
jgi:hypothetical protein